MCICDVFLNLISRAYCRVINYYETINERIFLHDHHVLLGAFAKSRKATISYVMSVCPLT
jgi:hypothetical protein